MLASRKDGSWPGGCLRRLSALMAIALLLLANGCAGSSGGADNQPPEGTPAAGNPRAARLVGTWRATNLEPETPFEFAVISFAENGTYSAQPRDPAAQSANGRWRVENNQVVFANGSRYDLEFRGNHTVVFRDPALRLAVVLARQ